MVVLVGVLKSGVAVVDVLCVGLFVVGCGGGSFPPPGIGYSAVSAESRAWLNSSGIRLGMSFGVQTSQNLTSVNLW